MEIRQPLSLLIEDDPMNRKLMQDVLSLRFDVLVAANGEQARQLLREQAPDIVFLDLQLPDVDGFVLMEEMKRNLKLADVPVIVVSAHAMGDSIDRAHKLGCTEYVIKPIVEDLIGFVERMALLVERKQAASADRGQGEPRGFPLNPAIPPSPRLEWHSCCCEAWEETC